MEMPRTLEEIRDEIEAGATDALNLRGIGGEVWVSDSGIKMVIELDTGEKTGWLLNRMEVYRDVVRSVVLEWLDDAESEAE